MSETKPIRLAIIGCGAVVQHHLLPALRRIGWRPEVLVDPSERNLTATAAIAGRSKTLIRTADWTKAAASFDAAIVAAPHALHGPIGQALIAAGKHVFMEKPLATSSVDARKMLEAAAARGTILSVGLLRRYLHIARWTKALLASGILGTIDRVEVREGFVFNWATSTDGLLKPGLAGGGVLMDTGAHTLDEVLWWLGGARVSRYRDDALTGVEADCLIDLDLPSGGQGLIELSRSRELPNTCRIEGSNGFVELHLYRNEVLSCSDNVRAFKLDGMGAGAFPEQRFPDLFSGELADFRKSIATGRQQGVDGAEGLRSIEMIEACYARRELLKMPWESITPRHASAVVAPGTKVAITGATGFIGGRLAERLLEQGAEVRCLVRSMGAAVRLARLPVEIRKVDLTDAAGVTEALKDVELVFHCAYDPRSSSHNLVGTRNLISACTELKVRRFVYTSTFSVYEPLPDGPLTEETRDGDKSWLYTRTKLELEKAVLDAVKTKGLQGTIIQPTIVYGPFSRPWTIAPAEMLLYGTVVLPGRGEGLCNAVHVDDVVDAMILMAQRPEAVGERFVISGPEPVTWGRFFEAFAAALHVKGPVYRPAAEIARENSGLMHDIKLVARNPKKIVQIAVRVPAVRSLLQSGLDALPKPAYDLVSRAYFGDGSRPTGMVHLPDPQLLRLYSAKASVDSEKARRILGYAPRFDFERGMAATALYLDWAFGAQRRSSKLATTGANTAEAPAMAAE
ncbi:NAD-dependent epimerase/dehydratase family protein [Pseudoroseomonas ludipueritiae]|uniref:NAD-dependent epimerase/dehydratase family protein n=1 Tax=Pseudoroseomonas ludipueritiae TaxID=198093 RepID=A0ABR7RBW6_9PROT|nr:NAD-dependent epimerase/dehydratase family protein [Pseudoroseomonas ludipueritiae]MBC9179319.1 NAD-dependent epimerase/dehydratase family protein [Pseudoroseomonas ludipueritiae]